MEPRRPYEVPRERERERDRERERERERELEANDTLVTSGMT